MFLIHLLMLHVTQGALGHPLESSPVFWGGYLAWPLMTTCQMLLCDLDTCQPHIPFYRRPLSARVCVN